MAENQYEGRGQVNSTWHAEPGKNLTFSMLLYPSFLSPMEQFTLNMAVSVGIHRALKKVTGEGLTVKWPNDIYYGDRKIGGMLIENIISGSLIRASVVGIGINVNQETFAPELAGRAGSIFQILHKHVNLISLLAEICSHTEAAYLKIKSGSYQTLRQDYLGLLYRFDVKANFRQNGEEFEGIIKDVSSQGLLSLETNEGIKTYNFKEIEFSQP